MYFEMNRCDCLLLFDTHYGKEKKYIQQTKICHNDRNTTGTLPKLELENRIEDILIYTSLFPRNYSDEC